MIVWLDTLPSDAPVGAKASTLARLLQSGFPVPPGFVVTDETDDVSDALTRLGAASVAVRSSALAEDGARTSFAGQHRTHLCIPAAEALPAIRDVMASGHLSEAYRKRHGVDGEIRIPVLVQRMVDATTAGVLFTRSPESPEEMLVEAAPGLGEAVVSGRVDPKRCRRRRGEARWEGDLAPAMLARLGELADRAEALLGDGLDIEWAEVGGEVWLLQARPITTGGVGVRAEEIRRAHARAAPEGTVWSRYSLAESLPAPRPMTWSLVRRLMSGRGAYGQMYRDLGYDPDPALDDDGVLNLIAGRAWYNLSREARMYFRDFPYRHRIETLKADPRRALYPVPEPVLDTGMLGRLPRALGQMMKAASRQPKLREAYRKAFASDVAPAFLQRIDTDHTIETWWQEVDGFAREAFKASAFAVLAIDALRRALRPSDPGVGELLVGAVAIPDADLPTILRSGKPLEELLRLVGHRAAGEMELAVPRWRENPAALLSLPTPKAPQPLEVPSRLRQVVSEARFWCGLREAARHWLMAGWAELRSLLLATGSDLVFDLEVHELAQLQAGADLSGRVADRRRHREGALALEIPDVLFSDDLDAIGRPAVASSDQTWTGQAVSPGQAEGVAAVRTQPDEPVPGDGFVLVCPSTDPGWTPLMLRACALVMETGGILSHGAIVAREAGVPAVVGVPGITRHIPDGARIHVDGTRGIVSLHS